MVKEMLATFIAFAFAAQLEAVFAEELPQGPEQTQMLYVSPKGNDAWSGRLREPNSTKTDGPLASIAAARDAIRKMRAGGPARPVRVEIADGAYPLTEPLLFTPEDSGTREAPVSYAAAAGAKPVIHGGRAISGFKADPASGIWTVDLPDVKAGKWHFRQLFVNGARYDRARDPDRKDYWHKFARTMMPQQPAALSEEGDVKPWRSGDEVEAVLLRVWDISRLRVSSVDWDAGLMRFQVPNGPVLSWWTGDGRYYLENSLSFLNEPGEWFLDRKAGILYVKPLEGHDLTRAEVVAPALEQVLRIEGHQENPVRHLHFQGLAFCYSDWTLPENGYDGHWGDIAAGAAIEGNFAEECVFEGCRFEHLGRYAVWLNRGCRQNRIVRCEFSDIGGGAVWVGEDQRGKVKNPPPVQKETALNEISENHVHDCGKVWLGSVGIVVGPSNSNRIARNHVHDLPYTGVATVVFVESEPGRCGRNVVEENRVHDVMQVLSDGAGIYNFGIHPGNVIRNNVVHDLLGWAPMRWSNGIYLDERSRDMLVENNLVFRVAWAGLCLHIAERNIVRNNIFADIGEPMIAAGKDKENVLERNIFVLKNDVFQGGSAVTAARMDKNLYWRPDGAPVKFEGKTFDQWRAGGSDLHSVVADPGFANLESGDFTLKSDSPAFKIGFEPFKLPLIGRGAVDYTTAVTAAMRHKGPGRMTAVKVPRVVAKRVSAPITIDGKLTEKVWQEAKAVPLTFTKAAAPHEQPWSRSLVLWDGENLYVAIVTDVPDMSKLHYDIATYQYPDHAAVSFQGVAGDQATAIYILRGWIGGTLECALDEWKTDESVKALQKGAAFAANAGNNEWTAEFKIPLAFDGVDLRPMKEIRFNMGVRRSEAPDKDRKWGMWADTGADAWRLRDAGLLILEKQ